MSPVRLRNSKPAAGKADKRAALAARRIWTFFAAELDCFSRGEAQLPSGPFFVLVGRTDKMGESKIAMR